MWVVWNAPKKCEIIEQPKKSNNFFNEIDRNIDVFSIYRYFYDNTDINFEISKNIDISIFLEKKNRYSIELELPIASLTATATW